MVAATITSATMLADAVAIIAGYGEVSADRKPEHLLGHHILYSPVPFPVLPRYRLSIY